ncbi:MAG: hypothetical protein JRI34_06810 [Deltaproteobacteria bacterium]|nr:hypothetical protein [Deltaproteobacteria bacterium]
MPDVLEIIRKRVQKLYKEQDLLGETIRVIARPLSPEEAIGNPEADDFPLQKGKERLIQAEFRGGLGQAFTDHYGNFEGSLEEVTNRAMENSYRRAVFVATLNAVLRHLGRIEKTVHCKDKAPLQCAQELATYITERFGPLKITQVGFQPRMVESLAAQFPLRVLDLDPDNIGRRRFGIIIEGPGTADEAIYWADLLLVTGTTLVNGTIDRFINEKPVLFYGTTIAGAASLMGWDRFCACGE